MIARTVAVAALSVAVACSSINTSGEGSGNRGGVDAGTATGSTDGEWTFFNVECGVSLGCWSGTRRLSKQGGAVEWLGRLDRFTVDADFVYFTRAAHGGDLEVARRDGTGRRTLYRGAKADAMAVWGGHLYWLQPYAPANGGKTTLYTAP